MIRSGPVAEPHQTKAGHGRRVTEDELISALPARSANREVKVGIFVLFGLVAFFGALFTMTDVGTFRGRYYVATVVPDAGGMRRGDPVQMRGVPIGRVIQFQMVPEGVRVRMELYNEYPVPADSRALVRSSGLLGGMAVDLIPGTSPARADEARPLPGAIEGGIMEAAAGVGTRADTVLERMTTLLSQQTIGAVGSSAQELQTLLGELNGLASQQRLELAALSSSLRASAAGVERATTGGELERTVARIDALTLQLDQTTQTLDQASTSLATVLGRMERGEGTLGKLSANDELYDNLNATVASLNDLVADIKREPRRYFNVRVF
jgi:phospholipid/cholesterol/gamma-HCH transport system substrate-binding protein